MNRHLAGEARELDRGDSAAAPGQLPALGGVDDLAGGWQAIDPRELDPLDVADDRDPHGQPSSTTVIEKRALKASPGLTKRSSSPVTRASVGAVIGSIAISASSAGA